jgi:hypothetical protein
MIQIDRPMMRCGLSGSVIEQWDSTGSDNAGDGWLRNQIPWTALIVLN